MPSPGPGGSQRLGQQLYTGDSGRRIAQTQEAERQQAQTNTGGVPTAPLVRRAQTQIQALFDRSRTAIFPPPGPDRGDSFFAKADFGRR